jgi:hypothetical protein
VGDNASLAGPIWTADAIPLLHQRSRFASQYSHARLQSTFALTYHVTPSPFASLDISQFQSFHQRRSARDINATNSCKLLRAKHAGSTAHRARHAACAKRRVGQRGVDAWSPPERQTKRRRESDGRAEPVRKSQWPTSGRPRRHEEGKKEKQLDFPEGRENGMKAERQSCSVWPESCEGTRSPSYVGRGEPPTTWTEAR